MWQSCTLQSCFQARPCRPTVFLLPQAEDRYVDNRQSVYPARRSNRCARLVRGGKKNSEKAFRR